MQIPTSHSTYIHERDGGCGDLQYMVDNVGLGSFNYIKMAKMYNRLILYNKERNSMLINEYIL